MQIQESLMTPVRGKYDAVVVGAGPAGASLYPLRALLPYPGGDPTAATADGVTGSLYPADFGKILDRTGELLYNNKSYYP